MQVVMSENEQNTTEPTEPPKRKRGRPRKNEVEAKKRGNRGVRGRPPGDAARINEFKARLLATSGSKVINKIIDIAQDDDHPGQMAALKMCIDRVLPLSYFEKDKQSSGKSSVQITITGVGGDTVISGGGDEEQNNALEGEVIDVTPEPRESD